MPSTYKGMLTFLQSELDRTATPYMPPPGLHRLNRTEYQNAIHDLLNLEVDPGKYLPSDDSTSGFDNIAGALGISSTLVEAYVSAAQKISRLAIGAPESPTLVVYRTPENTSQNYHVEGLPFGTRGGLLIKHVFPSDGEYTVAVTPIFGDNMTPTGFGSVPCERLEVSLDGQRLELLDWKGGGRQDAAVCRGQRTSAVNSGQSGEISAGKMVVRFKTTAGQHALGATFLETNFAPVLDLDKQFVRTTLQTGPTPGYTFFPHVGTVRIEGPFNAVPSKDSPSRKAIFVCRPTSAADETACARKIVTNLATIAFRRPAVAADVNPLMEFYQAGRKDGDFDSGIEQALARILASPKFIYRIEAEPGAGPAVRSVADRVQTYKISDIDLASRLSYFLWSRGPDAELMKLAAANRLQRPGDARGAGQADAQGSARGGAHRQFRRPVAEPARPAGLFTAAGCLSGLRRSARLRDAPRSGAAVRQHHPRGSQHHRPADGRLHVRQRAAREALRDGRTSTAASSAA